MEKQTTMFEDFVKAQSEFLPVEFDETNPHFKSKFASLAAIRKATQPALNKYGFFVTQPWESKENGDIVLFTRVTHKSGQTIELASCVLAKAGKNDQQFGSSLTYFRRYQMASALSVVGEKDDDAETSVGREQSAEMLPKVTSSQAKQITEALSGRDDVRKNMLEFYKTASVYDIPASHFDAIMKRLQGAA